jgi:hypothetical protein
VIAYGHPKIALGNVADGGHTAYKAGHGIVLLGVRRGNCLFVTMRLRR